MGTAMEGEGSEGTPLSPPYELFTFNDKNSNNTRQTTWSKHYVQDDFIQVVVEREGFPNGVVISDRVDPQLLFKVVPSLQHRLEGRRVFVPTVSFLDDEVVASVIWGLLRSVKDEIPIPEPAEKKHIPWIMMHCVLVLFDMDKQANLFKSKLWDLFQQVELQPMDVLWIWDTFSGRVPSFEPCAAPFADDYVQMMAWQILNLDSEGALNQDIRKMIELEQEPKYFTEVIAMRFKKYSLGREPLVTEDSKGKHGSDEKTEEHGSDGKITKKTKEPAAEENYALQNLGPPATSQTLGVIATSSHVSTSSLSSKISGHPHSLKTRKSVHFSDTIVDESGNKTSLNNSTSTKKSSVLGNETSIKSQTPATLTSVASSASSAQSPAYAPPMFDFRNATSPIGRNRKADQTLPKRRLSGSGPITSQSSPATLSAEAEFRFSGSGSTQPMASMASSTTGVGFNFGGPTTTQPTANLTPLFVGFNFGSSNSSQHGAGTNQQASGASEHFGSNTGAQSNTPSLGSYLFGTGQSTPSNNAHFRGGSGAEAQHAGLFGVAPGSRSNNTASSLGALSNNDGSLGSPAFSQANNNDIFVAASEYQPHHSLFGTPSSSQTHNNDPFGTANSVLGTPQAAHQHNNSPSGLSLKTSSNNDPFGTSFNNIKNYTVNGVTFSNSTPFNAQAPAQTVNASPFGTSFNSNSGPATPNTSASQNAGMFGNNTNFNIQNPTQGSPFGDPFGAASSNAGDAGNVFDFQGQNASVSSASRRKTLKPKGVRRF